MTIEEKDFRITQINQYSPFWDLELLKTIKPKGGEAREEFTNVGYGMTLPHCLRMICNYRVSKKCPEAVTLIQYLKTYLPELKKIHKQIEEALEYTEADDEETKDQP